MNHGKMIGKTRLDYVAEGNQNKSLSQEEMNRIIGKQRYPASAEYYLASLATESQKHGTVWVAVKAYCYGGYNRKAVRAE